MIYSPAEVEYVHAYNDYMAARADYYAGKVFPEVFIALRRTMEAKAAAWEAERNAA